MNLVEIGRNNFNSWHRHDADAIVAAYAEGGVFGTSDKQIKKLGRKR
jgi:hypothetical protein